MAVDWFGERSLVMMVLKGLGRADQQVGRKFSSLDPALEPGRVWLHKSRTD